VFIRASLGVGGVEWAPYEIFEGAGNFEVLQDPGLLDETAVL